MDYRETVAFKVYVFHNEFDEPEVRRFGIDGNVPMSFYFLTSTIIEVFPKLTDKILKIYWKDEDGDDITVSSDEELAIALASMLSNVKKFYAQVQPVSNDPVENEILHPDVSCDGCESCIYGFRYKCVVCRDYDLCKKCEQAGIHADHPLLKIPHPFCFDRMKLRKLSHVLESFIPFNQEGKHHRRRHSHGEGHPDLCKKKKKQDKRESGHETGDESEEGCHRRHQHKKFRKHGKCEFSRSGMNGRRPGTGANDLFGFAGQYSQMMNEVFNYFNPVNFEPRQNSNAPEETERTEQDFTHAKYLRSVGATLQKLLDPLGVNVEFEVRSNNGEREKKEEEKKEEVKEKKGEEAKGKKEEKPTPSAPAQQLSGAMKQKIDEITRILANQTMGSGNVDDGWVSYEELKKESEETQPSVSGESREAQKKHSATAQTETQESRTLYPDLGSENVLADGKVKEALEKMLAMGFTNEGGWLTRLLEVKKGDIQQVFEVLSSHQKN